MRAAIAAAAFALTMLGCPPSAASPAAVARHEARAVVKVLAASTQLAVHICANVADSMRIDGNGAWLPLAIHCHDGYVLAVDSLNAIADEVDAWSAASSGKAICAVRSALDGVLEISKAVDDAGVKVDPKLRAEIEDGLVFARGVVGNFASQSCAVAAADGGVDG